MALCATLPGYKKRDYEPVEKGILAGDYKFEKNIVTTKDGWRIRIERDGRFIPIDDETEAI
jgi:hypothetical protein